MTSPDGIVLFGSPQVGVDGDAWIYLATSIAITLGDETLDAALAVKRLGSPLHLVTAWNPGPERLTDAENNAANAELKVALLRHTDRVWDSVGSDPVLPYEEHGFAFAGVDRQTAIAIGEEFRQVAIFELNETQQIVLSCDNTWAVARAIP
ncbi:MAG: DUF3293 domain-containing protein [Acidimicrobiia bacterium]|jgi:Protein of unknown function (DUF3293)|nr:DUF3293 domain-containing protein [Acidimicrobiia bacterium]MBJ7381189.1 DUF3293 domain-containing protein [Acidimicrobiia bacterium]MBJ7513072.1 DUF3293 domain-containing protein [Acidimicrobiia bacterium]